MSKKIFAVFLLSVSFGASSAFAQGIFRSQKADLQDKLIELKEQLIREQIELEKKRRLVEQYELSRTDMELEREKSQKNREAVIKAIAEIREDIKATAQERRESFREKVTDARKRARIAAAHGRGLRMINRFRSAVARFDHILGRLETRIDKMESKGVDVSSVVPLMEEAKNMKVEADAEIESLKIKYESLLKGENEGGIGELAKEIAGRIKEDTEKLHSKLKEIIQAIKDLKAPEAEED